MKILLNRHGVLTNITFFFFFFDKESNAYYNGLLEVLIFIQQSNRNLDFSLWKGLGEQARIAQGVPALPKWSHSSSHMLLLGENTGKMEDRKRQENSLPHKTENWQKPVLGKFPLRAKYQKCTDGYILIFLKNQKGLWARCFAYSICFKNHHNLKP